MKTKTAHVLLLTLAIGYAGACLGAAPGTEGASRPGPAGVSSGGASGPASASQPASVPATSSQPASRPDANSAAPVVHVDGNAVVALHELGTVRAGSEHFVVYAVENAREANVAIRQIRPDCECISAVGPPSFLAARGATRITARFVAPKVNDIYGSELIVRTDDPQRRTIRLRILCRVVP